jgi:hypothetical protein
MINAASGHRVQDIFFGLYRYIDFKTVMQLACALFACVSRLGDCWHKIADFKRTSLLVAANQISKGPRIVS